MGLPPSPGRLSALSGWLPLPEAGSPLGRGRVFCLPPPASPALSGPRSQCPRAEPPPAGATLLGAVSAGAGPCRARPPPMAVGSLPNGSGRRGSGVFLPGLPATRASRPTQGAGPLPTPSVVALASRGWGAPGTGGGRPHFHPQCWGWSWGFQEPGLAAQPRCLLSHWVIHCILL